MDDLISRQAAIDGADKIIERDTSDNNDVVKAMIAWKEWIKGLPSAQPDITDEQAIEHLQSTGWMQSHDRILTERRTE